MTGIFPKVPERTHGFRTACSSNTTTSREQPLLHQTKAFNITRVWLPALNVTVRQCALILWRGSRAVTVDESSLRNGTSRQAQLLNGSSSLNLSLSKNILLWLRGQPTISLDTTRRSFDRILCVQLPTLLHTSCRLYNHICISSM